MKRNTFLAAITSAALLLLTAACSNDENNNEPKKEATQEVKFSFVNEDFEEDEALTRAVNTSETKPQTIDLGDCEAEISLESRSAGKKTRGATYDANGHYTIRAYQYNMLKGEIKGTFNSGYFTPDAGTARKMILPHGTYDFVAFNDDVTANGNNLVVTQDKAKTAMIGATTAVINQDPWQFVSFTMKHVGCMVEIVFLCQKTIPNEITATLDATGNIPTSVTYNPTSKSYTANNGAMTPKAVKFPARTGSIGGGWGYYIPSSTSGGSGNLYFLPQTQGRDLKLTGISPGTVFWKPIPPFNAPLFKTLLQMRSGKYYRIIIKLKPNFTYLMDDGSTGLLKNSHGKQPIAVVIDKDNKIAVSLNDAQGGAEINWCDSKYSNVQTNTNMVQNLHDALGSKATSGLDEARNESFTTSAVTGNKKKATNSDFPSFVAANYGPGPSSLKWFLPSMNDWKTFFLAFRFEEKDPVDINSNSWYAGIAKDVFTEAGGTPFVPDQTSNRVVYWTSTEGSGRLSAGTVEMRSLSFSFGAAWKTEQRKVRAFVKYQ